MEMKEAWQRCEQRVSIDMSTVTLCVYNALNVLCKAIIENTN
jgi:hypothetical protein